MIVSPNVAMVLRTVPVPSPGKHRGQPSTRREYDHRPQEEDVRPGPGVGWCDGGSEARKQSPGDSRGCVPRQGGCRDASSGERADVFRIGDVLTCSP